MGTTEEEARVVAVVVTYNPDLEVLASVLDSTRPQVAHIVVVDNGSDNQAGLLAACRDREALSVVAGERNLGVGAAQNDGIRSARQWSARHVLILDQDSVPSPDMVVNLLAVHRECTERGERVGAVGARYIGVHAGNESFFVQFGWTKFKRMYCSGSAQRFVRADFLISSGSLFAMDALNEVGLMDAELFIDHVDTEWFLRANSRGFPSYGACDATMQHGLGETTARVWWGRWRYVPRHRPFRYYYIFRNSLLLYRRPYAPWKWIINDVVRLGFMLVYYGLLSAERGAVLGMMGRGLIDGLKGRSGGTMAPAES